MAVTTVGHWLPAHGAESIGRLIQALAKNHAGVDEATLVNAAGQVIAGSRPSTTDAAPPLFGGATAGNRGESSR